ncbi:lysophospholipid acyltransferase family protein [Candidatus Izemoplasma sp. B36]|uniref:lysophospholipid acyltransferase family protein n=1 Tax=Candidatus Izemoplasma sp. B36 TaxID=3242468 RepID=UPI003558CE0B
MDTNFNDFNPKREDPYILVGNHPCLHDGVYASTFLIKPPKPIINTFMFTSKVWKFILTKLYPAIAKRKGQNDIITVRSMMQTIKEGRGVMLFPEGNSSFFGKESDIPYSTYKFMKKMKKDVVVCKSNGAYLVTPRWAKSRVRRGLIEVNFYTLFKGDEIADVPLEEIENKIKEAIKFNDFDWNRLKKHNYGFRKRAEGLERFMYICPKCMAHQTLSTKGNKIYCDNCGEIGKFNDYVLLENMGFDNLIEWDKLQKTKLDELSKKELFSSGILYQVDTIKFKGLKLGKSNISLKDNIFKVKTKNNEYGFVLEKIKGLTLTRKDEVSFDYEEETYFIKMNDPMLFYDVIKYKMEAMI